jgi:thiol-disulfide isomerase/thioredoxin
MPLCCIGGVCVPYSAIIPLLLYGIKYLFQQLAAYGLLPQWLCDHVQSLEKTSTTAQHSCCSGASSKDAVTAGPSDHATLRHRRRDKTIRSHDTTIGTVVKIESDDAWREYGSSRRSHVIVNITGAACAPCREIYPVYQELAAAHGSSSIEFVSMDMDACPLAMSQYQVMTLPTFLHLRAGDSNGFGLVDRFSGSNSEKLRQFVLRAVDGR